MTNVPYIYIPIIAMICYMVLLLAFMAAQKSKTIDSFILLLLCHAGWTGGSMLMRMQMYPGYEFWYQVSILSLFAIPMFLCNFIYNIAEMKGYIFRIVCAVCSIVILLLTYFQICLKAPERVVQGDRTIFVYTNDWRLLIPSATFFVIILALDIMIIKIIKRNETVGGGLAPLVIGLSGMFVGNLLSVIPNNIFPWDTLSGIIAAGLMVYSLYKKRLFKLTLLVSRGTIMALSASVVALVFANVTGPVENFIRVNYPVASGYSTLIIAICFSLVTIIFYKLIQKLMDAIFVREEYAQAQKLKEFSNAISKSLNLDEILHSLINVIKEMVGIERAYVCLLSEDKKFYQVTCSTSPLDVKNFTISSDNPCAKWFLSHDDCLLFKQFQRSAMYKSMWENEKRQLRDLEVECLVPLKCEGELVGILLVGEKAKRSAFSFDDLTFLDSIKSIVSIAIKNASLYHKAYMEARIDNLTGLLNRKFFYEKINEEFVKVKDQSLALAILNVDDFKLYNQLYGNHEGDLALQGIARIISACIGKKGMAARYGGKEFALILPYFDTFQAVNLVKDIQQQVRVMNKDGDGEILRSLTFSSGICVYPYAASDVKQLMENADMAVYNAKRSGKNKTIVYSVKDPLEADKDGLDESKNDSYSEYASTIYALTAAIDAKDHYTFSHSQKVAEYATILGRAIGLNQEHVQMINEAALLHDIGKIAIPESILSKPGKLTFEEYKVMQTHVEHSISIIRHLPSLNYVIPAAISHHERWDGKGYPRGIAGEDIPVAGRCLAIADSFDAMTAERPYKKSLSVEFAVNEIEAQAGKQFDPKMVPVFIQLVKEGKIRP